MFLSSEVHGLPLKDRLEAAMQIYFSKHPEFHPEDHNEQKVRSLTTKNLAGQNSHELAGLAAAMDDEPLYQEFLAKLQAPQPRDPPASSSEEDEPPWRRRGWLEAGAKAFLDVGCSR